VVCIAPCANGVDHFTFDRISSPQFTNIPFTVTLTAMTAGGAQDTTFTGYTTLTAAGQNGPDALQLTSVGPFVAGGWTGTVQVLTTDRFVQLQTVAAPGASELFHVEAAPYRVLNLQALDLAYDPGTQLIYASVPSDASAYSNSITAIDPVAGTIVASTPVDPIVRPGTSVRYWSGRMARSSGGEYIYVAVSNAVAVRQYNIPSRVLGPIFQVGTGQFANTLSVADLVVIPGSPTSVAVARADAYNPKGVAIYDNGVRRSQTTPELGGANINLIQPSSSPSLIYGYDNQFSDFEFSRLTINSSGVSVLDSTSGLLSGSGATMVFNGGFVFGSTGRLVAPQTPALVGTFAVEGALSMAGTLWISQVAPDTSLGRAYFLTALGDDLHYHLQAHDIATFLPLKSLEMPREGSWPTAFLRWGTNGLAFATSAGKLYLVQYANLMPGGTPADLLVTQSMATTPVAGTNFTISVTVSNQGPTYASEVLLTDVWPTNWALISATASQGVWATNASGGKCTFGMLAPGATATLSATFLTMFGGWQSNRAFAVANEFDSNLTNNNSTQEYLIRIAPQPNTISQILLPTTDLAYDPNSQAICATIPSRAGAHGNSLLLLQPTSGVPVQSLFIGNEPGRLARSTDNSYLYAAVNTNQSISRVNLPSQTISGTFELGTNAYGTRLYVEDMAVLPGQPASIAVSRLAGTGHDAVAVYDGSDARPNTASTPADYYTDVIEFGSDASMLFGHNTGGTGFFRMRVDSQGATPLDSDTALLGSFNSVELELAEGWLYSTDGSVIDPVAALATGRIPAITGAAAVVYDAPTRRLFFLQAGTPNYILRTFEAGSLLSLGTMDIPGVAGTPSSLVRWGADGLAFRTSADQLFVLRTSLVPTNPPADLALSLLSADGAATVGSNYVFSLQVTNAGPSTANHVIVTNNLPSASTVISVLPSQGTWSSAAGAVVCDLGQLANGAAANISISVQCTTTGILSFSSIASSEALDLTNSNNRTAWMVWASPSAGSLSQASATFGVNDIVSDRLSGRLYASVSSSAGTFANSLLWFNPAAGQAGRPVIIGPNPNRLAISANGQYLYAALDDASAIQPFDKLAGTLGGRFQLGSAQKAVSLAVVPTNPTSVAVYRTTDSTIAAYENGVKLANELTGMTLFAFSMADGALYACDGAHSGVPLYRAGWSDSGLTLSASQPGQQLATDLKSDGGLLFYNRGLVLNPNTTRVKALMPVPYNSLVEPDVDSGRVFYLTPAGTTWVLRAFDLTQAVEIGASTVTGISGTPKRLVRCGSDAFAICTDAGQLIIFRSSLVPSTAAADLALSQSASAPAITTNNNLTFLLSLTNSGPAAAQGIVVTQTFSLSVTSVTVALSTGSATFNTNLLTWQPGPLSSGAEASLSITLRPTQSGTLIAAAAARHTANDPNWANNVALSLVTVAGSSMSNMLQLKLATRELAYDPYRNVIYATLPSTNQLLGNTIGLISPDTGSLVGTLFAGSEPNQLALSQDGRFLYASLDGTMGIHRFDLQRLGGDLDYPLSLANLYNVFDLKIQPGNPQTIAVSRVNAQGSMTYPESVAVYDNDVARTSAAGVTKPIVFSPDGTRLYGTITPGMGSGFLRLQVSAGGVTQLSSTSTYTGDTDFDTDNGLVYGTTGIVLDPTVPTGLGTNKATGPVTVDANVSRVYYLTQVGTNFDLRAFPIGAYQSLGTNTLSGILGTPASLIRCGSDRLAFRTSNQVFIVHTTLVPTSDLVLTGTSAPPSLLAGQLIAINLAIKNSGPTTATNLVVTNALPASAAVQSASTSQGSYVIGSSNVVWNIGTLNSNAQAQIALTLMPTNSADASLTNLVTTASTWADLNTANNTLALVNYVWADNDRDGIADTWEIAHGFNPADPSDALLDADGDGQSNLAEYLAGTDPRDPNSALRILGFAIVGGVPQLTFSAVSTRSYLVEFTPNLATSGWTNVTATIQTNASQAVVPLPGTPPSATGFYRVKLAQ
jgi:uncharacterized repeat protein (TIGR01451 family)